MNGDLYAVIETELLKENLTTCIGHHMKFCDSVNDHSDSCSFITCLFMNHHLQMAWEKIQGDVDRNTSYFSDINWVL